MQQQWRIRIRGRQRKELDVSLIVQAVIALGQQLRSEARSWAADDQSPSKSAPDRASTEGQS